MDVQVFFQEIGVALPSVVSVSVDHAANDPTTPDSADGEVMLDIEVCRAVAPKAKFAVYFAPNNRDQGSSIHQRGGTRHRTQPERDFDQLGRPGGDHRSARRERISRVVYGRWSAGRYRVHRFG